MSMSPRADKLEIGYLLSGLLEWGILPTRSYISFEGHLFGLIAGVVITRISARREVRKS